MVIADDRLIWAAGRFVLRLFKAVMVSVAGLSVATFASLFGLFPAIYALRTKSLDMPRPPEDQVANGDDELMVLSAMDAWIICVIIVIVPTLIVASLLMPHAAIWLGRLAALVVSAFLVMALARVAVEITAGEMEVRYWPSVAAPVFIVALGLGGFSCLQILFARFTIWWLGDKSL